MFDIYCVFIEIIVICICILLICNLHIVSNLDVWIIWHIEIIILPRKKPKIQTMEERERDLAIKRDKIKLLCEQRKLQSNNEELTFEEEQEPWYKETKRKNWKDNENECEFYTEEDNWIAKLHHLPMLDSYYYLMLKRF